MWGVVVGFRIKKPNRFRMKEVFAYIRVSTVKQGEKGSSLNEQRDAIKAYAIRHNLVIVQWFEEMETAAKRGRREFAKMLSLLRQNRVRGIIIHKIDRGARNLRDWADLGDLIDQGIELHAAHESLDFASRGGRLSADIQAVVATDYVRNLREEVRKGFFGRLKQGFYPLPAPLGYCDRGKAKPKEIDPVAAPLVRKAFELYATGAFSLKRLQIELHRLGLRNRRGGRVSHAGLSVMLNNPFYIGIIRIKRTRQTYQGVHEPLISKALFDRVQHILRGKTNIRIQKHTFLFRRMVRCRRCGYALIGERQKGYVYYRCHTAGCPSTSLREERIEAEVRDRLRSVSFDEVESSDLRRMITDMQETWGSQQEAHAQAMQLQLQNTSMRITRLMDAYLDGTIESDLFEEKKGSLLLERKELEERLSAQKTNWRSVPDRLIEFLELTNTLPLSYETGIPEEKREILKFVTSNLFADGKNVVVKLRSPFHEVAIRKKNLNGGPHRCIPRTRLPRLLAQLVTHFKVDNQEFFDFRESTYNHPLADAA